MRKQCLRASPPNLSSSFYVPLAAVLSRGSPSISRTEKQGEGKWREALRWGRRTLLRQICSLGLRRHRLPILGRIPPLAVLTWYHPLILGISRTGMRYVCLVLVVFYGLIVGNEILSAREWDQPCVVRGADDWRGGRECQQKVRSICRWFSILFVVRLGFDG